MFMTSRLRVVIISIFAFSLISASALAAKKAVPETFSAIEDEEAPLAAPAPTFAEPAAKKPAAVKITQKTEKKTSAQHAYDSVPSSQAEAFAKRLKLTEALIIRHGRAYDYRLMTVNELEKILENLDSAPKAAPAAAAPDKEQAGKAPVAIEPQSSEDAEELPITQSAPAPAAPLTEIAPPTYSDEGSFAPEEIAPIPQADSNS